MRQAPIEFVLTATIVVSSTKLSVGGGGLKKGTKNISKFYKSQSLRVASFNPIGIGFTLKTLNINRSKFFRTL